MASEYSRCGFMNLSLRGLFRENVQVSSTKRQENEKNMLALVRARPIYCVGGSVLPPLGALLLLPGATRAGREPNPPSNTSQACLAI